MSNKDVLRLKGPQKFNKNGGLRELKTSDITEAILIYPNNKIFNLVDNWIDIKKNLEKRGRGRPQKSEEKKDEIKDLYVYHAYRYLIDGEQTGGRWYNLNVPLSQFQNIFENDENIFVYKLDNYEDEDERENIEVEFRIIFNKMGVKKLKKFFK